MGGPRRRLRQVPARGRLHLLALGLEAPREVVARVVLEPEAVPVLVLLVADEALVQLFPPLPR